MSRAAPSPSGPKLVMSFVMGITIGVALAYPAVPSIAQRLASDGAVGRTGMAIVLGMVLLGAVMIGLLALLRSSY